MVDQVTREIIVKAEVDAAFSAWMNIENFPSFMHYVKSVTRTGDKTSHWVLDGPMGRKIEWDAETTLVEPNKRIGWNSKRHSDMKTSGQVTFNALSKGETDITVTIHLDPPAGWAGDLVADLFGDVDKKLEADLRNFKSFIEGTPERIRRP